MIITVIEWLFGIMCPFIAFITVISLLVPQKKGRDLEKHHSSTRLTTESFISKVIMNFIYTSNHYLSKKIALLGVFS